MWFRFSEASGGAFSEARRRLVIGGPARWRLSRHESQEPELCPIGMPDALGRLALGAIQWSKDGRNWRTLRSRSFLDNVESTDKVSTVSSVTTVTPVEFDSPRGRIWVGPIAPGELTRGLGAADINSIQQVFDRELPRLPGGRIPVYVQDRWSDYQALVWLAWLLTEEIDRRSYPQPTVILTGIDGAGWRLAPLHGLTNRRDVPTVALPSRSEKLEFVGWKVPEPGPTVVSRSPLAHCACLQAVGSSWDAKAFLEGAVALPARLPDNIGVKGEPAGGVGRWVVQVDDHISGQNQHTVFLLVCDDPAKLFAPRPPSDTTQPGGIYWARTGKPDPGNSKWTVPCRLRHLKSASELDVLLTTLYSGANSIGGLHLLPEAETDLLIAWTGCLADPPAILTQPRPLDTPAGEDVRKLASTALQLPSDRTWAVSAPAMKVVVKKDLRLVSQNGRVILKREQGRTLQVGENTFDFDPVRGES